MATIDRKPEWKIPFEAAGPWKGEYSGAHDKGFCEIVAEIAGKNHLCSLSLISIGCP